MSCKYINYTRNLYPIHIWMKLKNEILDYSWASETPSSAKQNIASASGKHGEP